jgi:hypothetical protein
MGLSGCGGLSEGEIKETLEEQPFAYEYRDVSCEAGDAVAGTATEGRGGVEFLIVASGARDLGCDLRPPGPRENAETLTMFYGPPKSEAQLRYSGKVEAGIACAVLDANNIDNCGFPD